MYVRLFIQGDSKVGRQTLKSISLTTSELISLEQECWDVSSLRVLNDQEWILRIKLQIKI